MAEAILGSFNRNINNGMDREPKYTSEIRKAFLPTRTSAPSRVGHFQSVQPALLLSLRKNTLLQEEPICFRKQGAVSLHESEPEKAAFSRGSSSLLN